MVPRWVGWVAPHALAAVVVRGGGGDVTVGVFAAVTALAWLVDHREDRSLTRPGLALCTVGFAWVVAGWVAARFHVGFTHDWRVVAVVFALPSLWWWVAVARWWPTPEPVDAEDVEDVADTQPLPVVRTRVGMPDQPPSWGDAIEVGHDTPGWEPVAREPIHLITVPEQVDISPAGDEDGVSDDPDVALCHRVLSVWDGTVAAMHVDQLAGLLGTSRVALAEELRAAGAPVRPRVAKKVGGQTSTKAGLRLDEVRSWETDITG